MSDTAAFFAKKKKKKAFKFNANLVDAATVTSTIHVDAPAISTDHDLSAVTSGIGSADIKDPLDQNAKEENSEQWDDEAMAKTIKVKPVVGGAGGSATTAGLLDMKSLDPKGRNPDNIAEKLRLEETKAQLAAAREGMEREAAKLKEERERKEQEKKEREEGAGNPRFAAAAAMSGTGGKWVAPHLRGGGAASLSRARMGATGSQKLDVQDEELFPDLSAADKILEKKEKDQAPIFKAAKKTPVGGGASWASKTTTTKSPAPAPEPKPAEPEPEPEKKEESAEPVPAQKVAPALAPAAATIAVQPTVKKKAVKKKKKDLSTFTPGS